MRVPTFFLLTLLLPVLAVPAHASDEQDCRFHGDRDVQIAACSRLMAERLRAPSDYARLLGYRGSAYSDQREHKKAIADLTAAIGQDPNNDDLYARRAKAHDVAGDLASALSDQSDVIRLKPAPRSYIDRGRILGSWGEWERGTEDFTRAIALEPGNADHHFARAFHRIQEGRLAEARQDMAQALSLKPNDIFALSTAGLYHKFMGELDQALDFYSRALRVPGRSHGYMSYLYNSRADVYRLMRHWDRAVEDSTQAIMLEPRRAFYLSERAKVYAAKGDTQRAIEDYTRESQIDPRYGYLGLMGRARIHQQSGEWQKALDDASQAVRMAPKKSSNLVGRAEIHKAKGDWERASADYALAIATEPNLAWPHMSRAKALLERGQHDQALTDADAAVRLEPKNTAALLVRAQVKAASGRHDDAIADLNAALKISPRAFATLFHRGAAYEAKGDRDRALADYGNALAWTRGAEDRDRIGEKARARINALGG